MRDWRARREIIVNWDCAMWRHIPEAVHNLAEDLIDTLRIHRADDPHLEHNRRDPRERCRIVGHLSPVISASPGPKGSDLLRFHFRERI
jgi:hypothetical protein